MNTEKVLDNRATAIRKMSGLNRRAFCDKYGIAYRTYEYWERGFTKCPEWILDALETVIRIEQQMPHVYRILDLQDGERVVYKSTMATMAQKTIAEYEAASPGRYKLILSME